MTTHRTLLSLAMAAAFWAWLSRPRPAPHRRHWYEHLATAAGRG